MRKFYLLCLGFLMLSLSACYTPVGIQSPHTVEKGKIAVTASLHASNYFEEEASTNFGQSNGITGIGNVGIRYGIANRLDIGIDINSLNGSLWDLKYEFLGSRATKYSATMGAGIHNWFILPQAGASQLYFPLFLSYNPSENNSWFISPRYLITIRDDEPISELYELDKFNQIGIGIGYEHRFSMIDMVIGGQYLYSSDGTKSNPFRQIWQFGVMFSPRF
jgi:hypothetical protein